MYAFCSKQSSLFLTRLAVNSRTGVSSDIGFIQKLRIAVLPSSFYSYERRFTSLTQDNKLESHSVTVSYLIDSCGLPPQIAISASKKVHFESSVVPDAVLTVLKEHGCETAHVSKIVRKFPNLLVADPKKNLVPKLEFFKSIGLSGPELPKFLASTTQLLTCSLQNKIIPVYEFLRGIVGPNVEASAFLRGCYWFIPGSAARKHFALNVEHLKELGAPHDVIVSSISLYPTAFCLNSDMFAEKAKEVINMGLEPSKLTFVQGLSTRVQMSNSTWQQKAEIYKRWGWSGEDLNLAFRRNPVLVCYSETKIMNVMDFIVNKMGVECKDIAKNPIVLNYSLEKRTIPRCLVVRFLQSQGFVNKEVRMTFYLRLSEKIFLERFVNVYQKQVPQLLDLYQGKVDIEELGVRTDDINWQSRF